MTQFQTRIAEMMMPMQLNGVPSVADVRKRALKVPMHTRELKLALALIDNRRLDTVAHLPFANEANGSG